MTRPRRDATGLLAGLGLLIAAAVAVEVGPGLTARASDAQVVHVVQMAPRAPSHPAN